MLNALVTGQTWAIATTSSNRSTGKSVSHATELASSCPSAMRQFLVNEMKQIRLKSDIHKAMIEQINASSSHTFRIFELMTELIDVRSTSSANAHAPTFQRQSIPVPGIGSNA